MYHTVFLKTAKISSEALCSQQELVLYAFNITYSLKYQYLSFPFPLIHSMVVDTPELFEKLKQGLFYEKFFYIKVTHTATPDVLLQPERFEGARFRSIEFVSSTGSSIKIYPDIKYFSIVEVKFVDGENTLSGVPKGYFMYNIYYSPSATPTTENIDSILQWTEARKIDIQDYKDVALSLYKRAADLHKLTKLVRLDLVLQPETYEQIQAAEIIKHLPKLEAMTFLGNNGLTGEEILEHNEPPMRWWVWSAANIATFLKKQ